MHKQVFKKPPLPVELQSTTSGSNTTTNSSPSASLSSSSPADAFSFSGHTWNFSTISHHHHDFTPLPWNKYFETSRSVAIANTNDTFQVYETRSTTTPITEQSLFIFHHGGGHSALSFAIVSDLLRKSEGAQSISVLAFDCRGHGSTQVEDEYTLSLEQLSLDMKHVFEACYPDVNNRPREVTLVGHSLGGAVVVDVAQKAFIPNIIGTVVIDVVEGTAVESLSHMHMFLRKRPQRFKSLESAIEWSIESMTLHNVESARVSIPPQLQQTESGQWTWRVALEKSEQYWSGWFQDLSAKFLSIRGGKLLVIAGTDRLDKALTIGQMQGKFQMIVYPESGHSVQEDIPDKLVAALLEFWKRNQPLKVIKRFDIPMNVHQNATKPK